MAPKREIGLGQIGLGSWGPNLLRNFMVTSGCRVHRVADLEEGRFRKLELPGQPPEYTRDYRNILKDPAIAAVIVATPSETHYQLGREVLLAGKHLFVEKPLTLASREGEKLVALAKKTRRVIMVGHLLMYHPAVQAMANLIRRGRIGRVWYVGIRRRAFGRLQAGCSVLWDLGPHDISIALMVTGKKPVTVASLGRSFIQPGLPEISFTTISFAGGALAHIEESWMAPLRERQLLAVGDRGMLFFDELAPDGVHLKLFGKSIRVQPLAPVKVFEYLDEGASSIEVDAGQPLAAECREFLDAVRRGREPRSGGENGVEVLRVLEAAEASQRAGGKEMHLKRRRGR